MLFFVINSNEWLELQILELASQLACKHCELQSSYMKVSLRNWIIKSHCFIGLNSCIKSCIKLIIYMKTTDLNNLPHHADHVNLDPGSF